MYKWTMRFNKSATYEQYEYNWRKRKAQFLEDEKEKKEKEKARNTRTEKTVDYCWKQYLILYP